jgi:hypothetical protein
MPTQDSIISIPFVAGLNQQLDPDQLQPPELIKAENVVVRRGGRLEKRGGMQLVTPSAVFDSSGAGLDPNIEALGANDGKDGTTAILAAGSKLYEYVGLDATHGWRQVNQLPSCLGTLHSVDATGGDIIEVESMLNDAGTLRCTAWVLGVRNGQDMTNDTAISSQPATTYGLYVAVQRVSDGSFVTRPTRVQTPSGVDTTQVVDLRMALVTNAASTTRNWIIAFRLGYAEIAALVVKSIDGTVLTTKSLLGYTDRPYHRSFDITGVPGENRVLFAYCDQDTLLGNADVNLRLLSYDDTTGVFTTIATSAGALAANGVGGAAGVYNWLSFAVRGVVLETEPATATISMAVRVVFESSGAPGVLDGKLVAVRMLVTAGAVVYLAWAWAHRIGFQTSDDFVTRFGPKVVRARSGSIGDYLSSGIKNPSLTNSPTSSIVITGKFYDTTTQTYLSTPGIGYMDGYGWITGLSLYNGPNDSVVATGAVTRNYFGTTLPTIQNAFPRHAHSYPADTKSAVIMQPTPVAAPLVQGQVQINKQQVTRLVPKAGATIAAVALRNNLVYCDLRRAGVVWAKAIIIFGPNGEYSSVAIYDGNPGNPAAVAPSSYHVDDISVTAPPALVGVYAVAAADLEMYDDLNSNLTYAAGQFALDKAGDKTVVPQSQFDSVVGPEECVHRWDVRSAGSYTFVALSSVSAGTIQTPSGQTPYGYASPFAQNNFFEVYAWDNSNAATLAGYAMAVSNTLACALGGPWRLVSSMATMPNGNIGCVVSPGGDPMQRSAYLVSFSPAGPTFGSIDLGKPNSGGVTTPRTAEDVKYSDNRGLFVESLNMPRTMAVALNVPRLVYNSTSAVMNVGAIRDGSNSGSNEVFSIEYDFTPVNWRSLRKWGDYTVANGGLVSAYDGGSCNEISMLVWPQSDLTSLAYPRAPFIGSGNNAILRTQYFNFRMYDTALTLAGYDFAPFLRDVPRPYFVYEAGMAPDSTDPGESWGYWSTSWGGRPEQSYETIMAGAPRESVTPRTSTKDTYWASGVDGVTNYHFYGRYQSGYSTGKQWPSGSTKPANEPDAAYLVVWAPRSADGVTKIDDDTNNYSPTVANGDFLAAWTYECVDGTGRVVRSAPSAAVKFTIVSVVSGTDANTASPSIRFAEYRHGFFAPRLELTNRKRTAASDPRRVVLQPYFTAEPFSSVLYKVPFTNFRAGYQNDFVIPRNATRGVVPYSGAPRTTGDPYGFATSTLSCFDGPTGEYSGLLSQPFLYTTGNVLDNVPPPSAKVMCVHQNRLILGGADDATIVWMSKELSPSEAPGFNDALTLTIEEAGAVTGLASLNGNLIVFKRSAIFVVPGVLPDATGYAPSMGQPIKLPAGVGSIDHRSVVETPVGVFFQSERGLEVLYQNLQVEQVGQKVKEVLAAYPNIVSAVHIPDNQEVRFIASAAAGGSIGICYSYQFNVWSTHTYGTAIGDRKYQMALVDGKPWLACELLTYGACVYKESSTSAIDVAPDPWGVLPFVPYYVTMTVETAPIDVNQVQGYQRIKRARILATNNVILNQVPDLTPTVQMQLATDYAASGAQTASWTPTQVNSVISTQGRAQLEVHVAEQKGQKLSVRYVEGLPTDAFTVSSKGWGLALSNIALVVGLKRGLDKRILPEAKH